MQKYLAVIFIMLTICNSCSTNKSETKMHNHTNTLIDETSPYLLQHAHNPVDWHAWNSKNLEEAKSLKKPILISIGYSSCHWCHVMEHESFENEEIAKYMNEHFYCIKVDREERPDVDNIYMTAANIITGSGGWPLNCFAMPDGRPFHAGTYYPADGWMKLLESVDQQFQNNRGKIEEYATKLTKGIQMQETAISDNVSEQLDNTELVKAVEGWKANWDMKEGGINRAPKFPMPSNYNFLMDYSYHFKDAYTDTFVQLSLEKMAFGGIFDQIGGGFSRYSVDAIWKAPHFEKMLYDNAQLLTIYSKAYKKYNDPLYVEVIDKIITWLEREMLDESGLFYAALDADSEGEEGKFYVWKSEEMKELLGEDFTIAEAYYNIGKKALWEHQNNILLRDKSNLEVANDLDISEALLSKKIGNLNGTLLSARDKRVRPGLDDKCLTVWNGLLVTGLCDAYKATGETDYKKLAIDCMNALMKHQVNKDGLKHTYKNGESTIDGMLDDYAFLGLAAVSVFEISGDKKYIALANRLAQKAIEKFYDGDREIFYFNEGDELIVKTTEVHDNVIPATNSAMANLLNDIGLIYGNTSYLSLSENLIGKIQENMSTYPGGHSNWARAHIKQSMPFYEIAVVGDKAEALAFELQTKNLPNALIAFTTKESTLPLFDNRLTNGKTAIYVCKKGVCQMPVYTVANAIKAMTK
ncbi:thioredoxin domain-containing protein [Bacteroidia bacterium]|nr:thioredoxin domain-containing protein [Bacteroidia bacterium]